MRQRHGRTIERSEHDAAAHRNRERILLHREKYKRRQAIVEHPFGTLKRSWGGYYTLLRSKEKVRGEMAILFTCYNLRRAMSILGIKSLLEALRRAKVVILVLWPVVVGPSACRAGLPLRRFGSRVAPSLRPAAVRA